MLSGMYGHYNHNLKAEVSSHIKYANSFVDFQLRILIDSNDVDKLYQKKFVTVN